MSNFLGSIHPKPAVSLPLNPSLIGHGLGLCPKNPLISEVSSVSYEQIRVFFFKRCLIFFITLCHPERCASSYALASKNVSGSHFYFFKRGFKSFLSLLCFYFFIKIITTSSKGRETARSPKPAVSLPLNPSLIGHGLGLCPKNLHASK